MLLMRNVWQCGLRLVFLGLVVLGGRSSAQAEAGSEIFSPEDEPIVEPAAESKAQEPAKGHSTQVEGPVGPPAPVGPPKGAMGQSAVSQDSSGLPAIVPRMPSNEKILGRYRVRLAGSRPTFDDGIRHYDKLYGSPKTYPTIQADWFAWNWYATIGLSLRAGYYVADGYAAKSVCATPEAATSGVDCSTTRSAKDALEAEVVVDKNGPTTLTLVPLQIGAVVHGTPFMKKWLTAEAFFGFERLYFQEVRTPGQGKKAGIAYQGPGAQRAATSTEPDDSGYTNAGTKDGMVIGGALNILLNPLDERSVASMRSAMGLGYVYLSPYFEVVRSRADKGISFGRKVVGLGFTFESVH